MAGELPRPPAPRAGVRDSSSFSEGLVLCFGTSRLDITRNKDLKFKSVVNP